MNTDLTLIVCRNSALAEYQRRTVDPKRERFFFAYPGAALMGHRFHTIYASAAIVEDIRNTMPLAARDLRYEQYMQWTNQLRTRLAKDGVFMEI